MQGRVIHPQMRGRRMDANFAAIPEAHIIEWRSFSQNDAKDCISGEIVKLHQRAGRGKRMKRTSNCERALRGMLASVLLALAVGICAAQTGTEITLPGARVFPESLTSTADGTLIIGSLGHGNVLRIAPGKTMAEEWIKPGTSGLNSVLGVYADESDKLLWVCSNRFGDQGEATAVKTFDLKSGEPRNSYALPGDDALCNDIAIGTDRTAYVSDTNQAVVWMLKPGAKSLKIAAKDPLLAGADGLAFGDASTLYVNSVTTNKLLRLDLGKDGKSKKIVELKLPRPLDRPDGMRAIGKQRLLLAENSGTMSIVTFGGAEMRTVTLQTLKEGLQATPGVTATMGMAWIVEGKLNYMNDPKLKDKDPGPFKMYAVPLPKP
jgi:sugar lactone lactonase YvrE